MNNFDIRRSTVYQEASWFNHTTVIGSESVYINLMVKVENTSGWFKLFFRNWIWSLPSFFPNLPGKQTLC